MAISILWGSTGPGSEWIHRRRFAFAFRRRRLKKSAGDAEQIRKDLESAPENVTLNAAHFGCWMKAKRESPTLGTGLKNGPLSGLDTFGEGQFDIVANNEFVSWANPLGKRGTLSQAAKGICLRVFPCFETSPSKVHLCFELEVCWCGVAVMFPKTNKQTKEQREKHVNRPVRNHLFNRA